MFEDIRSYNGPAPLRVQIEFHWFVGQLALEFKMKEPTFSNNAYSKEQVAYLLLERIAYAEKKQLSGPGETTATKQWILQNYLECLQVVGGSRKNID